MTFEEKCRLVRVHSAIDVALGDSDLMDDVTDEEMRNQYPTVWAASQIADMIGPGPWDEYCSEEDKELGKKLMEEKKL